MEILFCTIALGVAYLIGDCKREKLNRAMRDAKEITRERLIVEEEQEQDELLDKEKEDADEEVKRLRDEEIHEHRVETEKRHTKDRKAAEKKKKVEERLDLINIKRVANGQSMIITLDDYVGSLAVESYYQKIVDSGKADVKQVDEMLTLLAARGRSPVKPVKGPYRPKTL